MLSNVSFSGATHLIYPKSGFDGKLAFEKKLQGNDAQAVVQDFPFDDRYKEAVVLSGRDLGDAGGLEGKSFGDLVNYTLSRIRRSGTFTEASTKENGARLLIGDQGSKGGGRAAQYLYQPRSFVG